VCTNSSKDLQDDKKEGKITTGSRTIFSWIYGFYRFHRTQQIPRPVDNNKSCIIQARRKDILFSRIRLWLIIVIISFIKQQTIRKEENMAIYSIYKRIIL
jgi:hypothetical protein